MSGQRGLLCTPCHAGDMATDLFRNAFDLTDGPPVQFDESWSQLGIPVGRFE